MDTEPLIHSFNTDKLPEEHPLARKTVACGNCQVMVHAFNNETMQDWVEWGKRALCIVCAAQVFFHVGADRMEFMRVSSKFPCVDSGE